MELQLDYTATPFRMFHDQVKHLGVNIMQNADSSIVEVWKAIPGYEGKYEASSLGRIKSLSREVVNKRIYTRIIKEKMLRPAIGKLNYRQVRLYKDGKHKTHSIHCLVALAFIGERKDGDVCDHINGIPGDDRIQNLQYITQRENVAKGKSVSNGKNKYIGVRLSKNKKNWSAYIWENKRQKHIGVSDTELGAHKMRLKYLREIENQ